MQVVAFDFATKQEQTLSEAEWNFISATGPFYWITASSSESALLQTLLSKMGASPAISGLLQTPQPEVHYELYEEALHFTLSEVRTDGHLLKSNSLSFLLGENFFAVLRPDGLPRHGKNSTDLPR